MIISITIGLIFFLAGLVQGFTGFGSALVAMPLLCLFIDVKTAVPLCMLCSVTINTIIAFQLKSHIVYQKILPFCLSSVPGIIVGTTFLTTIDSNIIRSLLGMLLIGYSIYSLSIQPKPRVLHSVWSWTAGFLSGAIGAAFSAGGPPTIIYMTLTTRDKNEIKATLTGFFLFSACITVAFHMANGLTTCIVMNLFITTFPFVFSGTIVGSFLYKFLLDHNYSRIIFIFLLLMGMVLISETGYPLNAS